MNVAVIGAGIAGLTSAYFLVREGCTVTVFDEEAYPAMKTSYANGGQVSVSNSETWNTWSNVIKGAMWMFKKDAPLLIRPSLDWDKAKWLARFLYHTASNVKDRNTAETIGLGIEARQLYADMIQRERLEFDQSPSGILHFYKDQKYFEHAKSMQAMYESNGCEWKILTPTQIKKIEPNMRYAKDIVGGTWTETDWTGDVHKFCIALSNVLSRKYHVAFIYNTQITDVNELDSFDRIVVANGMGSVALSKRLGDYNPIYPVKGYSITVNLDNAGVKFAPTRSLLDDQAKIVTARLGDRFRVAGTAELAGVNYDIRRDRIEPLLNWVHTNFPKVSTRDYSQWACLRPMTPNMMPIIGQSKNNKKVFYHVGHGHLGWTLSPATANNLTKLIKDSK